MRYFTASYDFTKRDDLMTTVCRSVSVCVCECACLHVHARALRVYVRAIQTIHPMQFDIFPIILQHVAIMYNWYISVHRVDQQFTDFF